MRFVCAEHARAALRHVHNAGTARATSLTRSWESACWMWCCRCAAVDCGLMTAPARSAAAAVSMSCPLLRQSHRLHPPPACICASCPVHSAPAPPQPGDLLYMPRGVSECLGRLAFSRAPSVCWQCAPRESVEQAWHSNRYCCARPITVHLARATFLFAVHQAESLPDSHSLHLTLSANQQRSWAGGRSLRLHLAYLAAVGWRGSAGSAERSRACACLAAARPCRGLGPASRLLAWLATGWAFGAAQQHTPNQQCQPARSPLPLPKQLPRRRSGAQFELASNSFATIMCPRPSTPLAVFLEEALPQALREAAQASSVANLAVAAVLLQTCPVHSTPNSSMHGGWQAASPVPLSASTEPID